MVVTEITLRCWKLILYCTDRPLFILYPLSLSFYVYPVHWYIYLFDSRRTFISTWQKTWTITRMTTRITMKYSTRTRPWPVLCSAVCQRSSVARTVSIRPWAAEARETARPSPHQSIPVTCPRISSLSRERTSGIRGIRRSGTLSITNTARSLPYLRSASSSSSNSRHHSHVGPSRPQMCAIDRALSWVAARLTWCGMSKKRCLVSACIQWQRLRDRDRCPCPSPWFPPWSLPLQDSPPLPRRICSTHSFRWRPTNRLRKRRMD